MCIRDSVGGLGGLGEISPGRFWCDPRNFAQVEQVVDAAQILPTPCPGPGFWPSFDPRKKTWVENRPEMPGSSRFWPEEGLFRPPTILPGSSRIWPRPDLARPWVPALVGVKNGSPKKWLCDEIILWWVGREIPMTQMNSIVYKTHLGRLLCPKP